MADWGKPANKDYKQISEGSNVLLRCWGVLELGQCEFEGEWNPRVLICYDVLDKEFIYEQDGLCRSMSRSFYPSLWKIKNNVVTGRTLLASFLGAWFDVDLKEGSSFDMAKDKTRNAVLGRPMQLRMLHKNGRESFDGKKWPYEPAPTTDQFEQTALYAEFKEYVRPKTYLDLNTWADDQPFVIPDYFPPLIRRIIKEQTKFARECEVIDNSKTIASKPAAEATASTAKDVTDDDDLPF